MNRIATSIVTLTIFALAWQSADAAGETLDTIGARISAIEARLSKIETTVSAEDAGCEQAMIDATRNSAPAPAPTTTASAEPQGTYVIKTGDTIGEIARKNGVPREALLEANRLSEGQPIYIGETLVIPSAPSEANNTMALSTPEKPKTAPAPEAPRVEAPKAPASAAPAAPAAGNGFHVAAKGETLSSISRQYGTTVAALKTANGLSTDNLNIGQKLRIPGAGAEKLGTASTQTPPASNASYSYDNPLLNKNEAYGYYTVRKGDNLYALARDFFTTMSELQRINRLGTSTLIFPGDELIVPTTKYNAYHNKQSNVAQAN